MAFALVQSKATGAVTSTNPTVTLTSGPTQGNLIVVVLQSKDQTLANITDPTGYTRRASQNPGVGYYTIVIVAKIAGAGESATVTFTDSTSVQWEIVGYEFSGNAASGAEFDAASAGGNGTAETSQLPGSLTPAAANELFIGVCGIGSAAATGQAVGSSFNKIAGTSAQGIHAYKIKTDAAAENPSFSWASASTFGNAIQCAFVPLASFTPRLVAARQAVPRAAYR